MEDVVKSLTTSGSRYLTLLKNNGGDFQLYDFVGGSVEDYDANPAAAMLREFEEETGHGIYSIDNIQQLPSYRLDSGDKVRRIYPFHITTKTEISPNLSEEHVDSRWLGEEDLHRVAETGALPVYEYFTARYIEERTDEATDSAEVRTFNEEDLNPDSIDKILAELE
jgi:8-oxo-dGTP pyrophosphatase MutT (NUDIX family)